MFSGIFIVIVFLRSRLLLCLSVRYLVQFLSLLSEQQAVNKMTPSNIAIVLGPNLLWPRAEGYLSVQTQWQLPIVPQLRGSSLRVALLPLQGNGVVWHGVRFLSAGCDGHWASYSVQLQPVSWRWRQPAFTSCKTPCMQLQMKLVRVCLYKFFLSLWLKSISLQRHIWEARLSRLKCLWDWKKLYSFTTTEYQMKTS